MRPDLLDPKTTLDWATAQIDILTQRIMGWQRTRPYSTVTKPDGDTGYEIIKARVASEPDPIINAEAGAIISMIRSSLDILAVTLAERNGQVQPNDVYFPISVSADAFYKGVDGRSPGFEKVRKLSDADRAVIERIQPYKGGNDILFSLRHLDIIRKHQRIVAANVKMRALHVTRWGHDEPFETLFDGGALKDGTPLCRVPAGSNAKPSLTAEVCLTETLFADGRPVFVALRDFATEVSKIIRLFSQ